MLLNIQSNPENAQYKECTLIQGMNFGYYEINVDLSILANL